MFTDPNSINYGKTKGPLFAQLLERVAPEAPSTSQRPVPMGGGYMAPMTHTRMERVPDYKPESSPYEGQQIPFNPWVGKPDPQVMQPGPWRMPPVNNRFGYGGGGLVERLFGNG